MGVKGRLEVDIDIKSSGDLFHEIFNSKPHHLPNITPQKIHGCEHDETSYGPPGSDVLWHYTIGGKKCYAKHQILEEDEENQNVRFRSRIIEGNLLEDYKSFFCILHVIPKGEITTVKWAAEFEKLKDDGPYPTDVMDFWIGMTKDIEAHHLKN